MQGLKSGALLRHETYRIEKILGQGGFGITYLATDLALDRLVAIKEFFPKDYCDRVGDTSHITLGTSSSTEFGQIPTMKIPRSQPIQSLQWKKLRSSKLYKIEPYRRHWANVHILAKWMKMANQTVTELLYGQKVMARNMMVNGLMVIWMVKPHTPSVVVIRLSEHSKIIDITKVDTLLFPQGNTLKELLRMVSPTKETGIIKMERSYEGCC